ncbi:MAG: FtsW/RodA/SpoVE family cell cycle protein [candidate division WOR-3 bacterium]
MYKIKRVSITPVEIIPLILGAFGLVMVFSASSGISIFKTVIPNSFIKQLIIFAFALTLFFLISKIKPKFWEEFSLFFTILAIFLLILTHLCGVEINGAKRWLLIKAFHLKFSFQPSIFAQFSLILFLAKKRNFWTSISIISIIMALIIIQPDISMALLSLLLGTIMLFLNGTEIRNLGIFFLTTMLLGILFISTKGYAIRRLTNHFSKEAITATVQAISHGGFSGLGLGSGMEKFFYIPLPDSDFIFSIIGEELGFAGCIFVAGLFLIYLISAIKVSLKAKDQYTMLLGLGLIIFLGAFTLIHIYVSTGIFPVTGIPLPFISSGGTALIIAYMAGGIIVSIQKNNNYIGWRNRRPHLSGTRGSQGIRKKRI